MKWMRNTTIFAALAAISLSLVTADAQAQGSDSKVEASLLGGLQILNKNDTALPDQFVNIPVVYSLGYRLTPIVSVEGEFTWMIPLQQSVELGPGSSQDRKTPDILAYQANVRANWPASPAWSPYVAGGVGAMTILSQTDADRVPQLSESQTMFALNFGAGVQYGLNPRWALRGDFREFVGFPSKDAQGLSDASGADPIWTERATVGLAYRF